MVVSVLWSSLYRSFGGIVETGDLERLVVLRSQNDSRPWPESRPIQCFCWLLLSFGVAGSCLELVGVAALLVSSDHRCEPRSKRLVIIRAVHRNRLVTPFRSIGGWLDVLRNLP